MTEGRDFTNGLVLGAAVGTALALLFAPQEGSALRRRLESAAAQLRQAIGEGDTWAGMRRMLAAAGDVKAGLQHRFGADSSGCDVFSRVV